MSDFSYNINEFITLGTFDYKFDVANNVVINSSSLEFTQNYLSIPLTLSNYNESNIQKFVDVNFTEFVETVQVDSVETTQTKEKLEGVTKENESLKNDLNEMIKKSETYNSDSEKLAIKQVILELRKKLGEGETDSDFSDTFPYTALVFKQLSKK